MRYLWSERYLIGKSVFIRQIWKDHILYCSILSMTYMIEIIFKKIKSCTFVPKYINFKNYKIKSWIGTTKDWDPVTKINPTRNHQWTEVKTKEESKKKLYLYQIYQQKKTTKNQQYEKAFDPTTRHEKAGLNLLERTLWPWWIVIIVCNYRVIIG